VPEFGPIGIDPAYADVSVISWLKFNIIAPFLRQCLKFSLILCIKHHEWVSHMSGMPNGLSCQSSSRKIIIDVNARGISPFLVASLLAAVFKMAKKVKVKAYI